MKQLILSITLFSIIFINCAFGQSIKFKEDRCKMLTNKFFKMIKKNDSFSIKDFNYFFSDSESELQMGIANEYFRKVKKLPKNECEKYTEEIRSKSNQEIIDYFFNKMRKYFLLVDSIKIEKLNLKKYWFFKVKAYFNKTYINYYIKFGFDPIYSKTSMDDILNSQLNSIIIDNDSNNYYINYLKKNLKLKN